MPNNVAVRATARLHLGFLDLNGSIGRRFGSIGLAFDGPATALSLRRAPSELVTGPEHARAAAHLETMQRHLGLAGPYELTLHEAIPAHAGLGSGTQLALAVAAALRRLEGFDLDVPGDAERLQRGARSGAGAGLFSKGGLIVDGGHGTRKGTPPVLARLAFPDSWRIVLVMDKGIKGVHGDDERAAFATLPQFQAAAAADICRHVLMQALPALVESDIGQFGAAIAQIQSILGDYFAPAQGGRYTSPAVGKIMAALGEAGAYGLGQSSWGPTGFAFAESESEAKRLVDQISQDAALLHLDVLICKGLNHGARIETNIETKSLEHQIQSG
jgi:beta-ribofuranosylaminobenzene 5'-phosphate synthase